MSTVTLFYDLETTGLDFRKHSIHQLSGVVDVDGRVVETFGIKLRPHPRAEIEESALSVCGVSEDEIRNYPPYEEGFTKFKSILQRYVDVYDKKSKAYLAGYNNSSFDNNFLRMLFDLCGDSFFAAYFFPESIDVMVLAGEHIRRTEGRRGSMPSFKLLRVCKELGIDVREGKAHDALYDVTLTRKLYKALKSEESEFNFML